MNESVVDASTVLAVILREPGLKFADVLERAVISAVNFAEVRTKLLDLGQSGLADLDRELVRLLRVVLACG